MAYREYDVTSRSESLRNAALVAWICYAVGLLTAWVTGPVGFIIALVKRADAINTAYESHFNAIIRSGVIIFIGNVVGWMLVWLGIGFLILGVIWIYNVFIVVKGLLRLSERRPYD